MGVPKQVWVIASFLALLMAAGYLGYLVWDRSRELSDVRAQLKDAREQVDKAKTDTAKLESEWKDKLALTDAQIETLRQDKEKSIASHKSLEDEMRAALESKDVTISQLQGKLTVNILDRVMFESGEAVLQPDGEAVLLKVAAILKQHPTLMIHVVGHTDNVPIRAGGRARFASNWELSTARALAAVRFMTEKGGVDPRRLGAVGYGEFRPIADNSTAQGRARNRRIAITVVSDEIVGSDAAATATVLPTTTNNAAPMAPATVPATNSAAPAAETAPAD
jgi:chemotaxis protein MotB